MARDLKPGDHVVIIYDYFSAEYENTDAVIVKTIKSDDSQYAVERWDGSFATYESHCLQTVKERYHQPVKENVLPELPTCDCPILTLMRTGCKCGGI